MRPQVLWKRSSLTDSPQVRDGYLKTIDNGAVERNTLYTSKIHLAHLEGTRGDRLAIGWRSVGDRLAIGCPTRR